MAISRNKQVEKINMRPHSFTSSFLMMDDVPMIRGKSKKEICVDNPLSDLPR